MLGGMLRGMRQKTSLTLAPDSMPLAKERARAAGLDVGRWLDQAIRNEAARGDVAAIEEWESQLPEADQGVLAAFDAADRLDVLADG
jgi:post-segregation antitoxin (ccd killing protein)